MKGGTLRELFQEGQTQDGRILNNLNIPLGAVTSQDVDVRQFG